MSTKLSSRHTHFLRHFEAVLACERAQDRGERLPGGVVNVVEHAKLGLQELARAGGHTSDFCMFLERSISLTPSHLSAAAHQLALRQRRPAHHGGLGDEVLRPRVAVQVEHRGGLLAHEVGGQHGLGRAHWATQEDVLSGQVGQQ